LPVSIFVTMDMSYSQVNLIVFCYFFYQGVVNCLYGSVQI